MPHQRELPEIRPAAVTNALSVDLEDYYHVWALSRAIPRRDWPSQESRVAESTGRVLDLFAEAGVPATFFVLGCVAKDHPALVRRIVAEGHELASHGYWHDKVSDMDRACFLGDLRDSRQILEDVSGTAVRGYRAPSFSIGDREAAWAYDCLAEAGYRYSSSSHPIVHDHYGRPSAPRFPYRENAGVAELPVATVETGLKRLSCAGGGFFRILPYRFYTRPLLRRYHRAERQPAVFYFHPWEIDAGQPRVRGLPWRSRFRHYTNLSRTYGKLQSLLHDFRWDRIDRVYPMFTAAR
jgi:polysaccharide deacetylase family protein (PEP-CTERM system associated)